MVENWAVIRTENCQGDKTEKDGRELLSWDH